MAEGTTAVNIPSYHEPLPPAAHLPLRQLLNCKLLLHVQIQREERLELVKVVEYQLCRAEGQHDRRLRGCCSSSCNRRLRARMLAAMMAMMVMTMVVVAVAVTVLGMRAGARARAMPVMSVIVTRSVVPVVAMTRARMGGWPRWRAGPGART